MLDLTAIEAILCDLDGVIFVGDEVIPGAPGAVARLREAGLVLRFITNTSASPRATLEARLAGLGIVLAAEELATPAALARRAMERSGRTRYRLLGNPALAADLGPDVVPLDAPGPVDWVVVGLHPPVLNHAGLTVAFRDLVAGAGLLALHANRMWRTASGMEPGLGTYVRGLEYAAGVAATVVGKPAPAFFREVLATTGVGADHAIMVGDDVQSDVGGAQAVGISGVLVRTGKYAPTVVRASGILPSLVVDDIVDLAARVQPAT